jgi:hypothetical protein
MNTPDCVINPTQTSLNSTQDQVQTNDQEEKAKIGILQTLLRKKNHGIVINSIRVRGII